VSYLAFELDALKKVPDCARSACLAEEKLGYGLLRMWSHSWSNKTDRIKRAHLMGFFADADPEKLEPALEAFDFVERGEGDFRIRGAERYLRISKGRSKGGKATKGNLIPGPHKGKSPERPAGDPAGMYAGEKPETQPEKSSGSPPGFHRAASTEHRITKEDLPAAAQILSSSVLKPGITAAGVEHFPSVAPDPDEAERQLRGDEGSFPPTGLGFCGWWNDARQAQGLSTELFNIAETAQWAERCMVEVGQERFWRAAHGFLDDEFWRPKGWPLSVFRSDSVWRTRANDPPPPKRVRA
jgi:hypothetical protein